MAKNCPAQLPFTPSKCSRHLADMTQTPPQLAHTAIVLRSLQAQDIPEISCAMALAEGYDASDPSYVPTDGFEKTVASYIDHPHRFGHVVTSTDTDAVVGFLFGEIRNRTKDTFEAHSIIDELDPALFPPSGEFCEIFDLWVAPDFRRRGIATQLKTNLEEYLRSRHCSAIYTHTELTNTHVLRMNDKLNYRVVRTGPIWDGVIRRSLIKHI